MMEQKLLAETLVVLLEAGPGVLLELQVQHAAHLLGHILGAALSVVHALHGIAVDDLILPMS